jgi:hypothetical protein
LDTPSNHREVLQQKVFVVFENKPLYFSCFFWLILYFFLTGVA